MDIAALINSGRLKEAIEQIQLNIQPNDWGARNNLAICYRRLGDRESELRYALEAHSIAQHSPMVLNTLFRALMHSDHQSLAARIYNSVVGEVELRRNVHFIGAYANLRINRTDQAISALQRAHPLNEENIDDLKAQHALARALLDQRTAVETLSKLEKLGENIADRRIVEFFEDGRYQDCIEAFTSSGDDEARKLSSRAAYLSAIMIDDFDTANRAAEYGVPERIRRFGECAQRNQKLVTVKGRKQSYQFPFRPKNLSVAIPHVAGEFYEHHRLVALMKCLPSQPNVIDVGANIGNHTVFFAGEYGARIVAFECNPILIPSLRESIALNGLDGQVDTSYLGAAVASFCGTIGFDFRREDFSSVASEQQSAAREVPCLSIDSLDLQHVDLLKVDVDGGEIGVLLGARQTIKRLRPVILIEVMNPNIGEALDILFACGYTILFEDSNAETHSDFIMIPRESSLEKKFY